MKLLPLILLAALLPAGARAAARFEARTTHGLALTPDGTRLLAVDGDGGRLAVFDVAGPDAAPALVQEIPVGLAPVAVRARDDATAWVVNEASDSVSVVALRTGVVTATLPVPDEPADVVFAGGRAFVTCARNNLLRVLDAATGAELAAVPLPGLLPRALAVSADGARVYATYLHSGNGTTVLPAAEAPPPPAPLDTNLPPAPASALLVRAGDPRVRWTVADHDVAEVDAATLAVTRHLAGAGTSLLALAVQPGTGALWVANTEAANLVRFEPALRGRFIANRLSVHPAGADGRPVPTPVIHDFEAGMDRGLLPHPAAQAAALAQPSALAFEPDGGALWVAAFGSDRVARVAADGRVLARVDLRRDAAVRGPRALALDAARGRLFVLNRLAGTVAVVDTAAAAVVAETPLAGHDPLPPALRRGRGFLFDARLSGNGTASCASCHLDADRDGLAWDLGVPAGALVRVTGTNASAHGDRPRTRVLHPMKGPMTTQTLLGLAGGAPFHWRGDRPALADFNATFEDLLGGARLADADMQALADYLLTLAPPPNPHRTLTNGLPATLAGGDPARGRLLFHRHNNHCAVCHAGPRGSDNNLDLHAEVGSTQPVKNPPLRTVYQRAFFDPRPGAVSRTGFGLNKDGTGATLPIVHPYILHELATPADFADVAAFVLAFDTGTPPAVGAQRTLTAAGAADPAPAAALEALEQQAALGACDLVVHGRLGGRPRQFLFSAAAGGYRPDHASAPAVPRAALLAALGPDDALTFTGVPPGAGAARAHDRDGDGVPDGDEPAPPLAARLTAGGLELTWPSGHAGWVIEAADGPHPPWRPAGVAAAPRGGGRHGAVISTGAATRFLRLRRTW
jgi:DNA-binding beta-propeller fold protein YncE